MKRRQHTSAVLAVWIAVSVLVGVFAGIAMPERTPTPIEIPEEIRVAVIVPANVSVVTDSLPAVTSVPEEDRTSSVLSITVEDVDGLGNRCGVRVDGELVWIEKGDVERISGLYIYVADVFVAHSAGKDTDACELVIGGIGTTIVQER